MKMHLTAKVPNEGARRLAWVIGERFGGNISAFATRARIAPMIVDGLLSGRIAPGDMLLLPIMAVTRCEVLSEDWRRPAVAWWCERPEPRAMAAAVVNDIQEQEARGGPPRRTARAGGALPPFGASPAHVRRAPVRCDAEARA